jgi:glycerol-3-phosphate dehydrogenase (NAD(P)+)
MSPVHVSVLGAGAWGTALAMAAAWAPSRPQVLLWARDPAQAHGLQVERLNSRYLPGFELPPALHIETHFEAALAHAQQAGQQGLVVVATPMSGLAPTLLAMRRGLLNGQPLPAVVWLCKGFAADGGALGHEIAQAAFPEAAVGVVSGPSFAQEVAARLPTALVAASVDAEVSALVVRALHSEQLRVYSSSDPVGVEVGGAVKNVLAIATGIADGMSAAGSTAAVLGAGGLGLNARAALITRGLAEMCRLGVALGAKAETFMGLSGLGDLVLTATGDLSRNRKVGLMLAQGLSLPQILASLGHVAEGARSAPVVLQRAQSLGVDMPITEAVVEVLQGRRSPAQALERLMGRQSRGEG